MKNKYEKIELEKLINESFTLSEVLMKLKIRSAGGNFKSLNKYIKFHNINIDHFNANTVRIQKLKAMTENKKIALVDVLITDSSYSRKNLKQRLYKEGLKEHKCELCGQNEIWLGKKMSLILDHINGVWNDNRIENLRIICPNCNATLDTHCGKNLTKRNKKKIENNISILKNVDFRKILTKEKINSCLQRRKVERPDYNVLIIEIEEMGYVATGRKYGVSDNAIRKWLKTYEKLKI